MKTGIVVALTLVAVLGWIPSRADDNTVVRERIKAAAASTQSIVIDLEMSPPPGVALVNTPRSINMLMTIANPTTAKIVAIIGTVRIETYQIDGMLYLHMQPGDSWRKMKYDPAHPPAQVLDILRAAKDEQISFLPDRKEAGVIVGVAQIEIALPAPAGMARVGPPVAMTCDYDKSTYRLISCANAQMSMSFAKYNDPSNTVELPPEAAGAVLVITRTPAPSVAVPSPSPDQSSPVPSPSPSQSPPIPTETPPPASPTP